MKSDTNLMTNIACQIKNFIVSTPMDEFVHLCGYIYMYVCMCRYGDQ